MGEILDRNFKGIQHTGIPVSNLGNSETFYNKLGFKTVMASTFKHSGNTGQVRMLEKNSVIIELYQLPEPDLDEIRNRSDGHIDHIAFDVDNIEEVFDELKNADYNIVENSPAKLDFWDKGCSYFNILGPDNERLEFNQRH